MLPDALEGLKSGSSLAGVAISVIGNVCISLALNIQKLAHQRHADSQQDAQDDKPTDTERTALLIVSPSVSRAARNAASKRQKLMAKVAVVPAGWQGDTEAQNGPEQAEDKNGEGPESRPYLRSKLWWLGLSLLTVGESGNFASYGFAPASLVAPLGSAALIANCFIAPLLLKERFRWQDLQGIGLCIVGVLTIVISSKQSDIKLDPDELLEAISRTAFLVYACISVACIIILAWLSQRQLGERFVWIDLGCCALTGGFTVLSAKAIASFLQLLFLRCFEYPITYAALLVLGVTAVIQVSFLQKALARFDSRVVVPAQFVMFTISAIVGSAVLYQEFSNVAFSRLLNFIFGCLTTFCGVWLLTREVDDEQEETPETESGAGCGRGHRQSPLRLGVVAEATDDEEDTRSPTTIAVPLSTTGRLRRYPSYSRSFSAGANLLIASSPGRSPSKAPAEPQGSPSRNSRGHVS